MATAKTKKPRQETWLDPPWSALDAKTTADFSEWFTRQEVLDHISDVDEVTLVYWEKRGILPRPIRRRRYGAPRALYPPMVGAAIATIRQAQEDGFPLDAAGNLARALAIEWVAMESLSDDIHRSKLGLVRLAHYQERFQHLPLGTIRGAIVQFLDANGKVVEEIKDTLWSDELVAAAAQTATAHLPEEY